MVYALPDDGVVSFLKASDKIPTLTTVTFQVRPFVCELQYVGIRHCAVEVVESPVTNNATVWAWCIHVYDDPGHDFSFQVK